LTRRFTFVSILLIPLLVLGNLLAQAPVGPSQQVAKSNPASPDPKKEPAAPDKLKSTPMPEKVAFLVRHLDKKVDDWQVSETANFRIMHDQKKTMVENVGKVAEETRLALQKKWFGDVSVEWDGKCSIYLHVNREKYETKTKQKNTLGHMRTITQVDGVYSRTIHIPAKEAKLLEDVLPHEVSHSVMAVRFQGKMPRWADEGMAMLAESPAAIDECLGRLAKYKKQDALFALEVMLQTDEPEHIMTLEFYSQSTSVVQFLTKRKGPATFTAFLRTCLRKGYEPALKEHYAIEGFRDLERQWQAFAFGEKRKK
jgi:hypothetical protein